MWMWRGEVMWMWRVWDRSSCRRLCRDDGAAPAATVLPERLRFLLPLLPSRGLRSPVPPCAAILQCRRLIRAAANKTIDGHAASGKLLDKSVNTIRFLAMDTVEKANSDHPGMPMGYILYDEVMRYSKNSY